MRSFILTGLRALSGNDVKFKSCCLYHLVTHFCHSDISEQFVFEMSLIAEFGELSER